LRVHAVENGEGFPGEALGEPAALDFVGDEFGLGAVVGGLDDADFVAAFAGAPEGFRAAARVVFDEAVGGVEDRVCAAVVLLQLYDGGVGKVVLELEDV